MKLYRHDLGENTRIPMGRWYPSDPRVSPTKACEGTVSSRERHEGAIAGPEPKAPLALSQYGSLVMLG